jgi:hypothetical protein
MRTINLIALGAGVICLLLGSPLAYQEGNPPGSTKEGGATAGKGPTSAEQAGKTTTAKAELLSLQREAEAIEARHQALDAEIAAWSDEVGRWMKKNGITIDPARVVLSLTSRSYFLHASQHAGSGDPEYSHLEDQIKGIQEKRSKIEADWLDFLSRIPASIASTQVKTTETQRSFDYELGDSTIPIRGVSARQSCCRLSFTDVDGSHCYFVKTYCEKAGTNWRSRCMYLCIGPVVIHQ